MTQVEAGHLVRRRLYLIRHGEVSYFDEWGQPVDPRSVRLSSDGEVQVEALRTVLADIGVDRAVSSDYPRARQTLELVLSHAPRSGEFEATAALREIKAGRLRHIPQEEYGAEVIGAYRLALASGSGFLRGERWHDFSSRVTDWFRAFLAEPDWQDAVIASHDAVNRVLMAWILNGNLAALPFLEQDPACLNIVDLDCRADGSVQAVYLRLLNFTPYNTVKAGDRMTVMERIAQSMLGM